jgi:hypothetical protein
MHFDDATSFLIDYLRAPRKTGYATYGYDVYLPNVVVAFRKEIEASSEHDSSLYGGARTREMSWAFFDAAWDLCRRGILRPSVARFGDQGVSDGNGYSLTAFGREWIVGAGASLVAPGRMPQLFGMLSGRLGTGFLQRASEAVQCHKLGTYLACCAMCGAAAESILLAVAIARDGEAPALARYRSSRGRQSTIDHIVGQTPRAISEPFRSAVQLLSYWRDDAAHGVASTISEIEAHEALARLLRFAQFASDNWTELTRPPSSPG